MQKSHSVMKSKDETGKRCPDTLSLYKKWSDDSRFDARNVPEIEVITTAYRSAPLFGGGVESKDEAEQLFRETLKLRKKIYGDGSYNTLESMNNLANLLSEKGETKSMDEAEKLYREVLQYKSNTLDSMHNLATLLSVKDAQQSKDEAEKR